MSGLEVFDSLVGTRVYLCFEVKKKMSLSQGDQHLLNQGRVEQKLASLINFWNRSNGSKLNSSMSDLCLFVLIYPIDLIIFEFK